MATYYVTTSGSDSNAGTTEGTAFASPGKACATAVGGDFIYIKSGTYTLTSTTNNANGGRFTIALGVRMEGYNSTIGDLGTAPVISAGSLTSFTMCTVNASFNVRPAQLVNIEFDGQSNSTVVGVNNAAAYTRFINRVLVRNCTTGFSGAVSGDGCLFNCAAISCGTGFLNQYALIGCIARACSSLGFDKYQTAIHCIAANNGNTGFRSLNTINAATVNCASHGNTNYGFEFSYDIGIIGNCIATSNTLHGYSLGGGSPNGMPCFNNANWNNTSGANRFTSAVEIGKIDLSANPYTDSTNLDFTLNNTSGGGALLRSAGFPGAILGGNTGYIDVGCYQVASGGGGGGLILPRPMNGGYSA